MKFFREAKEEELPLIWQVIRKERIFPSFQSLQDSYQRAPSFFQVSEERGPFAIGIVGRWRSHLDIGAIKAFAVSPAEELLFLRHLMDILQEAGYSRIISPSLPDEKLSPFLRLDFKKFQQIAAYRKTNFWIPSHPAIAQIRKFKPSRLAAVLKVEKKAFSEFWWFDRQDFLALCYQGCCFEAVFKNKVIGYNVNTCEEQVGTVVRIGVDPLFQDRGVGSQLLSQAITWFREREVQSIVLCTQVENTASRRLYEKFGFKLLPQRSHILIWEEREKLKVK